MNTKLIADKIKYLYWEESDKYYIYSYNNDTDNFLYLYKAKYLFFVFQYLCIQNILAISK